VPAIAGACALLLAARVERRLVYGGSCMYVGRCEWGATRTVIARIRDRCTMLSGQVCDGVDRSRGVVWIHPDVVAEVKLQRDDAGGLARCSAARPSTPRRYARMTASRIVLIVALAALLVVVAARVLSVW
jgi:ATP-dependent DNA ligase